MRQFDQESGDYTQERHQWLDKLTKHEILADIQKRQDLEISEKGSD